MPTEVSSLQVFDTEIRVLGREEDVLRAKLRVEVPYFPVRGLRPSVEVPRLRLVSKHDSTLPEELEVEQLGGAMPFEKTGRGA